MSTQDPTISKRSQDLRLRHKQSGDKSYLLWLSPATQARLARLKREGETLAQLVDRALEALEKNRQDGDRTELPGVANSVAEQREIVAKSAVDQRGSADSSSTEQRLRVAKLVATQRLVAQAEELREQGLSWAEIARRWNVEGVGTPSGKGKWHDGNVARLVKNQAKASVMG
jgi:hypothetical protein